MRRQARGAGRGVKHRGAHRAAAAGGAVRRLSRRRGSDGNAFRRGWYFTGDKAAIDEDGYFWFEGRADDVITSAAYRIGPFEVESALVEHPAVMEAAVVGRTTPSAPRSCARTCILAAGREASDELAHETPGSRQARHRAIQVPARDPLRRRTAQDHQRQNPPQRTPPPTARRVRAERPAPESETNFFPRSIFTVGVKRGGADYRPLSLSPGAVSRWKAAQCAHALRPRA